MLRIRRTRMPVGRTSPSTRLSDTFERPADVPSRRQRSRRRSTTLRLALQPLQRRQRRHDSATGRQSRFPTSSRRTDRQTPQLTVAAALTMRSSTLPNKSLRLSALSLSLSQRTLSSLILTRRTSAATTHTVRNSTLLQLPHTAKYVRSHGSLFLISCLRENFLRTSAKHVLLTCHTIT